MALAGAALALRPPTGPLSFPVRLPSQNSHPHSVIQASSPSTNTPSSSASSADVPAPKPFVYDRASPAVRWPELNISQYSPEPNPSPKFPPTLPENPDLGFPVPEPEIEEISDAGGPLELSEEKKTRTRAKKMTKLALKRAKDWRQRVQFLVDRIIALKPNEFVADVLDEKLVQMTPTDLCFLVKWIGGTSWQRALEVFEHLSLKNRHSSPSQHPRMLATIISVLGRHNQSALAEEIFSRATSISSSVQVYNAMMGVYAREGRFEKVKEILQLMKDLSCEPDLVSFNTLINARAKSGRIPPGSSLDFLADIRSAGLSPDTVTYNTILAAFSGDGGNSCLDDAVKVFSDMAASGCEPDLWTYNVMITIYGRRGLPDRAADLVLELKNKGLFPDAVTYNSLLHAYARGGDAEKVKKLCEEMVTAGFIKDEVTFNTIIHMYGKKGDPDTALTHFREMKKAGCKPDAVTLTVLIDALGKSGRITEAGGLISEMLDDGVRLTLRAFSALISGYAKVGMFDEAERMFDHMVRSGVRPDGMAYSVVIDALLRKGDLKRAFSLYRDMVSNGFGPDRSLFRDLIFSLKKDGDDDRVKGLISDMEKVMDPVEIALTLIKAEYFDLGSKILKRAVVDQGHGIDREDLLISILNTYSLKGQDEEAIDLLNFLKEHCPNSQRFLAEASIIMSCKKDRLEEALMEYNKIKGIEFRSPMKVKCHVYESLISCCEREAALSESCQLFTDMSFFGVEPSTSIYQSMISVYCKIGFPETAQHLLDRAENVGLLTTKNLSPYLILIESYGKLKLLERAESLVGNLRNKFQANLDRKVWNALIYAYAESGLYEKARAIFNIMIKDGHSPSADSVNGLMHALIIDRRLGELYVVIQDLQDMDFKISKSTILLMLEAFAKAGNIFEAKKIYHGMKAAGYLPTMHLYRSMISLLASGKRVRDVEIMISEMEDSGFKPDLSIFNSILKMYLKIEDFRKTAEVYERLLSEGFQPDDDTYSSIISMYCKDNRPEEGLYLMNEMIRHGLVPKVDIYKSLLAAYGREKLWEQAEELFERIQSTGLKLDRSVYHTMMKIHRDSGNHSKAEHVLSLMKEAGVEPTIGTMHLLMVSYGDAGKPEEAETVLESLKELGLGIGTLPYVSVIDAYLKNGNYDLGIKKMQDIKLNGIDPDHRIWTCFIRAASLCSDTNQGMMLLSALSDVGFDLPKRLLTGKAGALVVELDSFLDRLGFHDDASFNFINALEDLLWAFECRATASWIFQLAIKKRIYRQNLFRVEEKDWGADFRKLSPGAALVGLTLWLDHMQDASLQGTPESPKSVVLITGTSRYNMVSLNDTLKAYLWEMGSPFLPCKTRTGLLIAKAHSLRMWLKDSSFCMDLELKNAPCLPESNSIRLVNGCFMRAGLVPAFKEIFERMGHVRPKKFARLALMSDEKRDKAITADISGRREKLEKMERTKKEGVVRARKPTRLRDGRIVRRRHRSHVEATLDKICDS